MVNHKSGTANRKIEIEKFNTQRFWRRYMACFEGPHRELRAEYRKTERETQRDRTWGTFF